jgi:hypothetical protein
VVTTPPKTATNAYYQELLGTTISVLLSQHTPLQAFSDCSSAIRRTHQALYSLGPAVGHLQHGTLLLGIRDIASRSRHPTSLHWTPSHPERIKPQSQWTVNDWGIHQADLIAGALGSPRKNYMRRSHRQEHGNGTWKALPFMAVSRHEPNLISTDNTRNSVT